MTSPSQKSTLYSVFTAFTALLLTGCVTASSTQNQIDSQTQQNRSLLRIEQQQSRDRLSNRASLQRQLDEKSRLLDMRQIQDNPSQESRQEITKLNSEIAKLKKSILESTE